MSYEAYDGVMKLRAEYVALEKLIEVFNDLPMMTGEDFEEKYAEYDARAMDLMAAFVANGRLAHVAVPPANPEPDPVKPPSKTPSKTPVKVKIKPPVQVVTLPHHVVKKFVDVYTELSPAMIAMRTVMKFGAEAKPGDVALKWADLSAAVAEFEDALDFDDFD